MPPLKAILKSWFQFAAAVAILPTVGSYWLRVSIVGRDRALESSSQWLSLLPGLTGIYLRSAFYRLVLADCHPSARIEFGTLFSKVGARLGANCYIGPHCHLGCVEIGEDVLIAAGVHIPSGAHIHGTDDLDRPIREQPGTVSVVRIGAGSWIGAAAIVMADVGQQTIVGAGSVVTKPLPDRVVAAGVPARVLRKREEEPNLHWGSTGVIEAESLQRMQSLTAGPAR